MYVVNDIEVTEFLYFVENPTGNKEISLKFNNASEAEVLAKSIILWIGNHFPYDKISVSHNTHYPTSFIKKSGLHYIKFVINRKYCTLTAKRMKSSKHIMTDDAHIDFWTTCGPSLCLVKMQQTGNTIVKSGYIGGDIYTEMFFNAYGVHHEIMSEILQRVVVKRKYVEENGLWIDIQEIYDLYYDEEFQVDIHGDWKNKTAEDMNFLVFKVLVAIILETHYSVIAYEYITCVSEGHFRISYPFDYEDIESGLLRVCDYIIKDNILLIIPTVAESFGSILIWRKYGPKLLQSIG